MVGKVKPKIPRCTVKYPVITGHTPAGFQDLTQCSAIGTSDLQKSGVTVGYSGITQNYNEQHSSCAWPELVANNCT